jgi:hypothetical protein
MSAPLPVSIEKPARTSWKRRLLHVKWRARHWLQKVLGWIVIGLGLVFLAVGFVFALLPGHLGIPVMLVGLIMVLRNAFWARRQFIRLKKKHPNWVMPLRKLLRRNPPVASVFWHSLLRTERFVLRKGRTLPVWRRRFFRKAKA